MDLGLVIRTVGQIQVVIGLAMATALPVSWWMGDPWTARRGLAQAALVTILAGVLAGRLRTARREPRVRESLTIVTFTWIAATFFGALPFVFVAKLGLADALFETMSGFTTTGASVLCAAATPTIESLPKGLLYWRAMTHWLGGMGIVVLSLAILPSLATGWMQLFRAEVPGPTSDALEPRIANTAKLLYGVYLLMSIAETFFLWLHPKMSLFDAWCHTCATVATGGFSTRDAGIAAFDSVYIEVVLTVFMFLAGANFALHLRFLRGKPLVHFLDEEFRFYALAVTGAIAVAAVDLRLSGAYGGDLATIVRHASFSVVSIVTTTGFSTEDFDRWPSFCRGLMILLMFFGGCGGSTSGGIKAARILLLFKCALGQVRQTLMPHLIPNIRLGEHRLGDLVLARQLTFFFVFVAMFVASTTFLCLFEPALRSVPPASGSMATALETALSASASALCNVGPGLSMVGPTQNYGWMAPWSKLVLVLTMLVGRLELFTVLVLLAARLGRR